MADVASRHLTRVWTWKKWFKNDEELRDGFAGILDCRRSVSGFQFPFSVHISIDELTGKSNRWCELPPRHLDMGMLLDCEEDAKIVSENFYPQGDLFEIGLSDAKASAMTARQFWHIEYIVASEDDLNFTSCNKTNSWVLWRPNIILENCLDIEIHLGAKSDKFALDIGCGSGRDSVFLAARGWQVVGIDNVSKCCSRARKFAERHHVDDRCRFLKRDFKNADLDLPVSQFHLIVICRTRVENWDTIDSLMAPGGFVVYHHFMVGAKHPESGLIEPGALAAFFGGSKGHSIIHDSVVSEPSDGRPLTVFVSMKNAPI